MGKRKPYNEYNIVWRNTDKEIINDDVDHYSTDEAIDIIYQEKAFKEILFMGKRPLTKAQMRERKAVTGIDIT